MVRPRWNSQLVLPTAVHFCSLVLLLLALRRGLATAATTPATAAPATQLTASLLLSRGPLLTPTLHPLAKAYYDRSFKLRHSMSNPTATNFYFKPGSVALRRFQEAEHAREVEYYGTALAGKKPEVGEVQPEPAFEETPRDHWAKADEERGDHSLERYPEEEVFCLVQEKGKWTFPSTTVKAGEGLDEAVDARIVGPNGSLDGKSVDTWLVTRKPIGVVRDGDKRVSRPRTWRCGDANSLCRTSSCARTSLLASLSSPRLRATLPTPGSPPRRSRRA